MIKYTLLALSALGLAACGSHNSNSYTDHAEMGVATAPAMAKSADMAPPSGGETSAQNPSNLSFLAYRYNYSFSLPAKTVAATAQSHVQTCLDAGPNICQILGSRTNGTSEENVSAYVSLRAEPSWLKGFRAEVESSVKNAKGEITNSSVSADDLTRTILDTDARLKSKIALRGRLERLLETRDAELKDLLALERELARVQGEIESATTTLNALKKRVSMSVLDMNYQSSTSAVSRGALSPIGDALKNFIGDFADALAAVIRFFSHILPWLIFVILPLIWLIRRFWRKRLKS